MSNLKTSERDPLYVVEPLVINPKKRYIGKLLVWGARGGLPSSGEEFSYFGQATSCVQLDLPSNNIIFDAGSGIAKLGETIIKNHDTRPIDIFIGHYHYDHIIGLPFFAPLFSEKFKKITLLN